jgi:tetratricopeptide (TPR) repeat protein
MNEAMELLQTNELNKRILPIILPDISSVFSTEKIESIMDFWKAELELSNVRLQKHSSENFLDRKRKTESIYNSLGLFFSTITDMRVESYDNLRTTDFYSFLNRIKYFEKDLIKELKIITDLNDNEEKEIAIDEFLIKDPQNHYLWFQRGVVTYKMNQFRRAEASYKKVLEIFPQDFLSYYNLAMLYHFNLEEIDKAKEYYLKCIELNPRYVGAHNNLAHLFDSLGNKELAKKHWLKTIELDPDSPPRIYYNLGCLFHSENPDSAKLFYEKSLELDSSIYEIHINLGSLFFYTYADFPKAEEHFLKALSLDPNRHEAYKKLYDFTLTIKKDKHLANKYYEKLQTLM